jgi:hypothetical protein
MDKHPGVGTVFPVDRLDVLTNHRKAVDAEFRFPRFGKDEVVLRTLRSSIYDPTRCPPGYHVIYNFWPVPVPEYYV